MSTPPGDARFAETHFDGGHYFNPWLPPIQRSRSALLRWLLERRKLAPWTTAPRIAPSEPAARQTALHVTWIGHATTLIQSDGLNLLTDPVYSDTVSPLPGFGPRRAHPPGVAYAALPPIDVVLISHAHYDHLDAKTIRALARDHDSIFIAGPGLDRWLTRQGVRRVVTLDWWQRHTLADDNHATRPVAMTITGVPAQHWSRRGLFDRNRSLWLGYVIDAGAGRVYFAGDTGYHADLFDAIRAACGAPDLALLPIGAYEPRDFMKRQHMNPADAVKAFERLESTRAMGIHFGTFRLTDEAREQPPIDLAAALKSHDIDPTRFRAPDFGETIRLS